MTATVQRSTLEKDRVLKYVCNACAALGLCIALIASKFVGMSASAMPGVTVATGSLWVIALIAGYLAFMNGKKAPLAAPLWLKLSGFVGAYSSLLLTLMILTGYLFYPTIEKSFVAKWNPYWLMLSLFVMGLAIDFEDWKRIVKSPKVIGIAVLIRWACMPLAAYVVGYLVFVMLLPGQTGKLPGRGYDSFGHRTHRYYVKRAYHDCQGRFSPVRFGHHRQHPPRPISSAGLNAVPGRQYGPRQYRRDVCGSHPHGDRSGSVGKRSRLGFCEAMHQDETHFCSSGHHISGAHYDGEYVERDQRPPEAALYPALSRSRMRPVFHGRVFAGFFYTQIFRIYRRNNV